MRKLLVFVLCFGLNYVANSQEIIFQSISSTGSAFQSTGPSMAYTVGELVVEPNNFDSTSLGSGLVFAIDTLLVTSIQSLSSEYISVNVFPNPTHDLLHIQWTEIRSGVIIELYDILGRQLDSKSQQSGPNTTFNLSYYDKGMYVLRIKLETGEGIAVYQIQKL